MCVEHRRCQPTGFEQGEAQKYQYEKEMMLILDSKLVQDARSADMLTFLEKRSGFTFAHRGSGYRCRQHPSLAVKDDRLSWYCHNRGISRLLASILMLLKAKWKTRFVSKINDLKKCGPPEKLDTEYLPKSL